MILLSRKADTSLKTQNVLLQTYNFQFFFWNLPPQGFRLLVLSSSSLPPFPPSGKSWNTPYHFNTEHYVIYTCCTLSKTTSQIKKLQPAQPVKICQLTSYDADLLEVPYITNLISGVFVALLVT